MNNHESVLVVDDEIEICMLLANMLKKKGYMVNCVHTIQDARQSLVDNEFDLLFLDLNLPDGLGFHFIEDARSHNKKIKVIVISAYDGNIERQRAESEGVNYFLPKPFNRNMVNQALTDVNP